MYYNEDIKFVPSNATKVAKDKKSSFVPILTPSYTSVSIPIGTQIKPIRLIKTIKL